MSHWNKRNESLENLIEEISISMNKEGCNSDNFGKHVDYLERLISLRRQNETTEPKPISRDVMLTVFAQIAITVIVLSHERTHTIGTKALNFLPRWSK